MGHTIEIPEQDVPVLLEMVKGYLERIPGQPTNAVTRFRAQLRHPPDRPTAPPAWVVFMNGRREVRRP